MKCPKKADQGHVPEKPQASQQKFPRFQRFPKQMRKCCFRLALLTVFLAWPALQWSSDDFAAHGSPRNLLHATDSNHDGNVGHDQDTFDDKGKEKHVQSGLLENAASTGSDIYLNWKEGCDNILDSGVDVIPYKQGKKCWESCGDLLAIRVLDSWLGQWQYHLQERILFFDWPQYAWLAAYVLLSYFVCLACIGLYFYIGEEDAEQSDLFWPLTYVLGFLGFLIHTWFSMITCLTLIAAMLVEHPEAVYEEVPWAAKWIAVYRLFKFPGVKTVGIPALPLKVTLILTILLGLYLFSKAIAFGAQVTDRLVARIDGKDTLEVLERLDPETANVLAHVWTFPGCLIIAMVGWCFFVSFVLHAILAFLTMFHAGSHGIIWVCLKSSASSAFGWMPPTAPFAMGFAYAVCAFLHGVLQEFPHYENRTTWQKKIKKGNINEDSLQGNLFNPPGGCDKFIAPLMLFAKFGVIFADISFDCAQTVLFFCRGQIFFGLCNISGLVLQMSILLVAMAQSMAQGISSHEASLLEVVLQSDSIIHFRSSWQAGIVVSSFYEKIYREAFGETYVSMAIAIVAVFTVPLAYPTDCGLFIISICLSLSSVMSGVADALEYHTAEQETERLLGFHVRQIPSNDYKARKTYKRARAMYGIGLLRVAEALAPVVSVAVCIHVSSAKVTMVFAMTTSAILFLIPIVPTLVAEARECFDQLSYGCSGSDVCEFETILCEVIPFLILITVGPVLIIIFSPLFFFLPFTRSVALPQIKEFETYDDVNPMRTLSQFRPFMLGKCCWVFCFLAFFAHGYLFPEQSYCKMASFIGGISGELSHIFQTRLAETKALIAAVQSLLIGGAFLGWTLMVCCSYYIQRQRLEWTRKDAEVAHLLKSMQLTARRMLQSPIQELKKLKIAASTTNNFGRRKTLDKGVTSMLQAMLGLLVNAIYGAKKEDWDDDYLWKDPVQYLLRGMAERQDEYYHSPCAMGEDLIRLASSIPKSENNFFKTLTEVRNHLIELGLSFHGVSVMGVQGLLEDLGTGDLSQAPYASISQDLPPTADAEIDNMSTGGISWEIVRVGDLVRYTTDPMFYVKDPDDSGKRKLLIMDPNDKWFVLTDEKKRAQNAFRFRCQQLHREISRSEVSGFLSAETSEVGIGVAEIKDKCRACLKTALAEARGEMQATMAESPEDESKYQPYSTKVTELKEAAASLARSEVEAAKWKDECATREAWLLNVDDIQSWTVADNASPGNVNKGDLVIFPSSGDQADTSVRLGRVTDLFLKVHDVDDDKEVLFAGQSNLPFSCLKVANSKFWQKTSHDAEVQVLSPIQKCLAICSLVHQIPTVLRETSEESENKLDELDEISNFAFDQF